MDPSEHRGKREMEGTAWLRLAITRSPRRSPSALRQARFFNFSLPQSHPQLYHYIFNPHSNPHHYECYPLRHPPRCRSIARLHLSPSHSGRGLHKHQHCSRAASSQACSQGSTYWIARSQPARCRQVLPLNRQGGDRACQAVWIQFANVYSDQDGLRLLRRLCREGRA